MGQREGREKSKTTEMIERKEREKEEGSRAKKILRTYVHSECSVRKRKIRLMMPQQTCQSIYWQRIPFFAHIIHTNTSSYFVIHFCYVFLS